MPQHVTATTEVAALFYSLIESAKLVGIDPALFLRDAAHRGVPGEPVQLPHERAAA